MNWNEFKDTKDTKGKMAFMIMKNNTRNIFDILNSRKTRDLEKYFSKYQRSDRLKVKKMSTDFYIGYINLAKKYFKNADIVIDRYHIISQVYTALNISRVKLCKKSNPNYNKLKKFWKLILKNRNDLKDKKNYCINFRKEIS